MARSAKVAAIREWSRQQQAEQKAQDEAYEEHADFIDHDLEGEARAAGEDEQAEKIRENRLRRMADRQGLRLHKSRRRDYRALDYGTFIISDDRNRLVYGEWPTSGLTLDEVEKYLTQPD